MFSLVLPFYNGDWSKLKIKLPRILAEASLHGVQEIILAHNGEAMTKECLDFCRGIGDERVQWVHSARKGIGAGYKVGIDVAHGKYVVLSASDLPFGWTDIDSFKKISGIQFAIGSKAHPRSHISGRTLKRKVSTSLFFWFRFAALGANTPKDSQGSLIVDRELAAHLARQSEFDHYLFSLEMATLAIQRKIAVVELPVVLIEDGAPSAVSVAHDGFQMLRDIFKLRKRMRDA